MGECGVRIAEPMRSQRTRQLADRIGIASSTLCAVHCLVGPILLVAGTAIPSVWQPDESFHLLLLWAILPAALVAFGLGCWRHKDRWVLALGLVGLMGICAAALAGHERLGEISERALTIGSATLLITAHGRNARLCRTDEGTHEGEAC